MPNVPAPELQQLLQQRMQKPLWMAELDESVQAMAFARDGRLAIGPAVESLFVVEGKTGSIIKTLAGHDGGTFAVGWSNDGVLASAGADGHVRWWDIAAGREAAAAKGGAAWVEHLAWSPDGSMLATAAGKFVKVWDARGALLHDFAAEPKTVQAIAWAPDSTRLAIASYETMRLRVVRGDGATAGYSLPSAPLSLAWRADGRILACGCMDAAVRFWDMQKSEMFQMTGYATKVKPLAWTCDGKHLVTGGGPGVAVWDFSSGAPAGSGAEIFQLHLDTVADVACSPTEPKVFASVGTDGTVARWNLGYPRPKSFCLFPSPATTLAFAPDGKTFVVGCEDGTVAGFAVG